MAWYTVDRATRRITSGPYERGLDALASPQAREDKVLCDETNSRAIPGDQFPEIPEAFEPFSTGQHFR